MPTKKLLNNDFIFALYFLFSEKKKKIPKLKNPIDYFCFKNIEAKFDIFV